MQFKVNRKEIIKILLIEDNEGDIELILEALNPEGVFLNLEIVKDGEDALDYLFQRGNYRNVVLPNMILLDLNLPKIKGLEILKEIKSDENLKTIPVIILTTSDNQRDIENAYNLKANSYLVKPIDFREFKEMMKTFHNFWFVFGKLPTPAYAEQ